MHRGQHPRTDQESPHQAERKGQDGEQHGPAFQSVAFFRHARRMEQGGGRQPGHEAGVLDRIPKPPAAPAKLIISPPTAKPDAEGQKNPGRQGPWSHPARPGRVDAALDQRRDGEGKGHRQANIAEIQHRRMEGQPRVLEQWVEIGAVQRRRRQPREGIGGGRQKQQKADPDQPLHPQHTGPQRRRQGHTEKGDGGAEQSQDQHPQQHRALVIAPDAGHLVQHRHRRMGIGGDRRQ